MITPDTKHAVVLGGSIAGLLAAHVLSRHFERVTIVERDTFPALGEPRKGVPQSRQLHGLLAGGRRALDAMFPDFSAGMIALGALDIDIGTSGAFYVAGRKLPESETGLRCLSMSRPLLEGYIRQRVLGHANVVVREQCVAQGLLGDSTVVTGVRIASTQSDQVELLQADLVVDATGRGSHMPEWLERLRVQAPSEERVTVHIHYSSCTIRRKPEHLAGKPTFIVNPHPPSHRAGAALALEGDRYVVAMTGYLDEPVPADYAGMLAFARSLDVPDLYELLRDAELLSEPSKMRHAASVRRRYERLTDFPTGLLVCGDALCCFNPAYGQGMTVAALEARTLEACLREGTHDLFRRFTHAAAKLVDVPWSIVVGGDYAFEGVQGERSLSVRIMNVYMQRLLRAAAGDAVVCRAFMAVTHMVEPPSALFAPRILWRVLRARPAEPLAAVSSALSGEAAE
jgi:2-polyprenyl-6-methoxyphenol hydroxylase-like FAD-dependent oxidoreductase